MFFFNKDCDSVCFNQKSLEQAYLSLLADDINAAEAIFSSVDSPRSRWGCVLVGILRGCIETYPTYFEIRNFLEIDLDFFIKNGKLDYIELILGATEHLVNINNEVYKYVARVMLENRFPNVAFNYLEKSKNVFYNDPELHFLYAKYYLKNKDYQNADYHLDECLNILPDYYPAKKIQEAISIYLA